MKQGELFPEPASKKIDKAQIQNLIYAQELHGQILGLINKLAEINPSMAFGVCEMGKKLADAHLNVRIKQVSK